MSKQVKDAMAGVEEERIRVEAIKDSKLNPRKEWDNEQMHELMDSIRTKGLLQAIMVRKTKEKGAYEVVCGSRRLEAHRKLKIEYVSARVVEMDDEQAREVAVVENLQRADLAPMDEAEAFDALLKPKKVRNGNGPVSAVMVIPSISDISKNTGKSVAYIARRLKLLELPAKVRKALSSGEIDVEVAMTIARLPDQDAMIRGFDEVVDGYRQMETKEAIKHLTEAFTTPLSNAPFDTTDADLVSKAGACTVCPHRSGNQAGLFSDLTKNVCTKPSCFSKKKKAHFDAMAKSAKEKGMEVIKGNEAYSALHGYSQSYVKLAEKCQEDPKHRTFAQLLGKSASDLAPVMAVDAANNRSQKVVSKSEVVKLLKDKGFSWAKKELVAKPRDPAKEARAERLRDLRDAEFSLLAFQAVAKKMLSGDGPNLAITRFLRMIASEVVVKWNGAVAQMVALAVYGETAVKKVKGSFAEQDLTDMVANGNGSEAMAVLSCYHLQDKMDDNEKKEVGIILGIAGTERAELDEKAGKAAVLILERLEEAEKTAGEIIKAEEQDGEDEGGNDV